MPAGNTGLQYGLGDLFAPLRIERHEAAIGPVRLATRLAAAALPCRGFLTTPPSRFSHPLAVGGVSEKWLLLHIDAGSIRTAQ